MRILITGASGFIGSYLLRELIENGHEILSVKRKTTNLYRIDDVKHLVNWINIDTDWEIQAITFKPEIIFNLAWNGVSAKDRTNWDIQLVNIEMQQKLLNIALKSHSQKIIGIGSQAEYGAFNNKIDENYPANPNNSYGAVKNVSLILLKTFCEINHIDWYWFRVFPCFGEMEADCWLIPSLIKNILTQKSMDLTAGEQKLAYLYVKEVAKAIYSPIEVIGKSGIYNICSDNPIPLKELVIKIRNFINPDFVLNFGALPYRFGQCMHMEGDTTKLKMNLYNIRTSDFSNKLEQTIIYYKNKYQNETN